jgi:twitching motility protein PilT
MDNFTDIYLPALDSEPVIIFPGPEVATISTNEKYACMLEMCKKETEKDFRISYEGIPFRVHRMSTLAGDYYAARRLPSDIWTLQDCGIPKAVRHLLLAERMSKGGLVIVSGMPGNGKSTTCAGLISDRLIRFGGMCATIEDPPEMPLQGLHGKGFCVQRDLGPGGSFPEAVRETMRAYPTGSNTIMLIGEIRDAETAALALRSSVDGRLVIVSVHAGDVIQTIYRLLALASDSLGSREARNLMASSLRAVIHQKLITKADGLKLSLSCIFDTNEVCSTIRNPKTPLETLKNSIREQSQRIESGQPIPVRPVG